MTQERPGRHPRATADPWGCAAVTGGRGTVRPAVSRRTRQGAVASGYQRSVASSGYERPAVSDPSQRPAAARPAQRGAVSARCTANGTAVRLARRSGQATGIERGSTV
jgi:hypothetical protein